MKHKNNQFSAENFCIQMLRMPQHEAKQFIDVNRNKLGWMKQLNNIHRNNIDEARVIIQAKQELDKY